MVKSSRNKIRNGDETRLSSEVGCYKYVYHTTMLFSFGLYFHIAYKFPGLLPPKTASENAETAATLRRYEFSLEKQ